MIIVKQKQIGWANRKAYNNSNIYSHTLTKGTISFDSNITRPPPCIPCSTYLDEYLKMPCCHTYKPQLVEHVRETCYEPHSIMTGGVPNTNIVHNVARLLNSSATYWGGESFWTHPYEPQLTHSHRQHSPIRATTQGFLVFIHHVDSQLKRYHSDPQLKECHVFPLYPVPQLKGYVPSHNSKNKPANLSLR